MKCHSSRFDVLCVIWTKIHGTTKSNTLSTFWVKRVLLYGYFVGLLDLENADGVGEVAG